MDFDLQSAVKMNKPSSLTVIKFELALDKLQSSDPFNRNSSKLSFQNGSENRALSQSLEQLSSEYGKAWMLDGAEEDCPQTPLDMNVYNKPYLKELCKTYRQSLITTPYRYVTLSFRIMRRNADMYVGSLLSQKGVRRKDLYKSKYLPIWTHCLRIKMRVNVKVGLVFHGIKSRLGLASVRGLHFCLDGFLGIEAYGDAFGNVGTGVCPWMELSGNGSPKSLRLNDGDNVYLSSATQNMLDLVEQRKLQAAGRIQPMANAMKYEGKQDDSTRASGADFPKGADSMGSQREQANKLPVSVPMLV